jgi:hypothetical protein
LEQQLVVVVEHQDTMLILIQQHQVVLAEEHLGLMQTGEQALLVKATTVVPLVDNGIQVVVVEQGVQV